MPDSICDSCRDPGYCCRDFTINVVFPADMPRAEVDKHVAEGTDPWGEDGRMLDAEKTPFFHATRIATRYIFRGQHKPHGVTWGFNCDRLGTDGRCMQYEDRPQVCRHYPPKEDFLCIEYDGSFKGALSLYREGKKDE